MCRHTGFWVGLLMLVAANSAHAEITFEDPLGNEGESLDGVTFADDDVTILFTSELRNPDNSINPLVLAKRGLPQFAFFGPTGADTPAPNQNDFDVGDYFLAPPYRLAPIGQPVPTANFTMHLSAPVYQVSGQILDVDNKDSWQIDANPFTNVGVHFDAQTSGSGDGLVTPWSIAASRPSLCGPPKITSLHFVERTPSDVAFDNFSVMHYLPPRSVKVSGTKSATRFQESPKAEFCGSPRSGGSPLLGGFSVTFDKSRDRQIQYLGVNPQITNRISLNDDPFQYAIHTTFAAHNSHTPFGYSLDFVDYAPGISFQNNLKFPIDTNTGRIKPAEADCGGGVCLYDLRADMPDDFDFDAYEFVLQGFEFSFTSGGDHQIKNIEILEDEGILSVGFHDKNLDDNFHFNVSYAWLPTTSIVEMGSNSSASSKDGLPKNSVHEKLNTKSKSTGSAVVRGFRLTFPARGDQEVHGITVDPNSVDGEQYIDVALNDRKGNDPFSWAVKWAILGDQSTTSVSSRDLSLHDREFYFGGCSGEGCIPPGFSFRGQQTPVPYVELQLAPELVKELLQTILQGPVEGELWLQQDSAIQFMPATTSGEVVLPPSIYAEFAIPPDATIDGVPDDTRIAISIMFNPSAFEDALDADFADLLGMNDRRVLDSIDLDGSFVYAFTADYAPIGALQFSSFDQFVVSVPEPNAIVLLAISLVLAAAHHNARVIRRSDESS